MLAEFDAGSFRDRSGRIFSRAGRIFRTVMQPAAEDFEFVRSTELFDSLVANGQLIAESRVDDVVGAPETAVCLLEHPRLPFVSYPYEWTFAALKSAALLHLDVHLAALEHGVTLSDSSAYNVQFIGAKPIFIDVLSFVRYIDGSYWTGHQQFCNQFLNPLLLRSLLGVPHNAWYRGALEGIATEELNDLLPWYKKLSWNTFTHVSLQARLQRNARQTDGALKRAETRQLPLIGFKEILRGMRKWIARLEPKDARHTSWDDYATQNSYAAVEEQTKRQHIAEFVAATSPKVLFDVGCNTGNYSTLALESGADYVVGFDFDQNAVQAAFERSTANGQNFLPLILDAANPSPAQGWRQSERPGLSERSEADSVLALALLHHLVISKNIPMDQAIGWLISLAPCGIIEFVQKTDPMVQKLLRLRKDVFDDYDQDTFETILKRSARIVKSTEVSASGRRLYWYSRDES